MAFHNFLSISMYFYFTWFSLFPDKGSEMVYDLSKVSELVRGGRQSKEVPVFRIQTFIFIFWRFKKCMFTM